MQTDPLVALWHDTSRPLNWRPWTTLAPWEQAILRWHLMQELLEENRADPAW